MDYQALYQQKLTTPERAVQAVKIGRASCRERVFYSV